MPNDLLNLTEHARQNREAWNADSDAYQARNGAFLDQREGLAWGVWQIPEHELGVLGEVSGKDVLELGCGGAQWSVALAKLGARVVGLDISEVQLGHARRRVTANGVSLTLVHASAEAVPLPDRAFDVVFCDYGAMTFCDPRRTVPEAARLLRAGGLLAFSTSSPVLDMCWPAGAKRAGDRLVLDYFELHRIEDEGKITFTLPYGAWIRLFRSHGFAIEDLIETRPTADAVSTYRDPEEHAWARKWPAEVIFRVRRR